MNDPIMGMWFDAETSSNVIDEYESPSCTIAVTPAASALNRTSYVVDDVVAGES